MIKPHSLLILSLLGLLVLLLPLVKAQVQVKGKYQGTIMKSGYNIYTLPSFNNTQLKEEAAAERKLMSSKSKAAESASSESEHGAAPSEWHTVDRKVNEKKSQRTGESVQAAGVINSPKKKQFKSGQRIAIADMDRSETGEGKESGDGSFTFGKEISVDFDIVSDGTLSDVREGGRVWRLGLRSASAVSLNLLFDKFWIPPGGELYVRGETASLGAFVGEYSNKASMKFSTMPLPGRILDIEYYAPPGVDNMPLLHIASVIHGYRLPIYEKSASGFCHRNAPSCEEASDCADQSRTVVVLMTENGKKFCSGCMMNNAAMDGRQYFLTARHCVSGPRSDPGYNILGFNFQAASCDSTKVDLPIRESASGLRPLVNSTESDFALFEVEERIPDSYHVYMAGWSILKTGPPSAYGVHHPKGDTKKICKHNGPVTLTHWHPYHQPLKKNHWRVNGWQTGCTEHGSSGSPLFDHNGLVIGQLHGGHTSCQKRDEDDYYGALWASFELGLAAYLNPFNWTNLMSIEGAYLEDIRKGHGCLGDSQYLGHLIPPSAPKEQELSNQKPNMMPPMPSLSEPVRDTGRKPRLDSGSRPLTVFDILEADECLKTYENDSSVGSLPICSKCE